MYLKRMKLVAILRIKDAISTVEECLGKLSSLVDEIIVLDNGSTDGTLETYQKFPRIKEILHTEGFHQGRDQIMLLEAAKARNADWILLIDADEIFEKNMTRGVLDRYMSSGHNTFGFRMYNFWLNRKVYRIDGPWFEYTLKAQRFLCKNLPGIYFVNRQLHSGVIKGIPGKVQLSPYRLKHYGYADKKEVIPKWKFYTDLDKKRGMGYYSHLNPESKALTFRFVEFNNPVMNYVYITALNFLINHLLNMPKAKDFLFRQINQRCSFRDSIDS